MACSIREADAKCLLWYGRSYDGWHSESNPSSSTPQELPGIYTGECVLVTPSTALDQLPLSCPWLLEGPLVAKPDVLLKRRGKLGLVLVGASWEKVKAHLEEYLNTSFTCGEVKGRLSHFIVEPCFSHEQQNEFYVAIRTKADGDEILFSSRGGIEVGDVEETAERLLVPVGQKEDEIEEHVLQTLVSGVADTKAKTLLPLFLRCLYTRFCALHLAFLEINPFSFDSEKDKFRLLDAAAKIDRTADFLCQEAWKGLDLPNPFGRELTPEELYIRELDQKTGASLKLTVLNPKGRIWTMIAGGGASVVYADTICDLGFAHELCNYGEYSGAPSEVTTYEYARTILSLVTAPGTYREEGKVLLIGGGIANFTSVADTFKGIIRALKMYASKLLAFNVSIYVRRGGPNYQDGLKLMREVGVELGLKMKVFGPETYITAIIPFALRGGHEQAKTEEISKQCGWDHGDAGMPAEECSQNGSMANGHGTLQRVKTWKEVSMAEVDSNPVFDKCVERLNLLRSEHHAEDSAISSKTALFSGSTHCIVWGLQTRAVQEMLDFDHVCGRTTPSVSAIVYEFSVSHMRPFYFGTEEIFIPVCQTLAEAVSKSPQVSVLINFASMRSAASVCRQALQHSCFKTIAVIAEGVPERVARELGKEARVKGVCLIGPATVGGMKPGAFRIGNTGGSLENIMNAKLYRPGSVGFVTKSGGMLNELNNILSVVTNGACEAIAIGGDRFPGTSMLQHLLRFEQDPEVKMLMMLGEVGGSVEYEVAAALKDRRIRKPLVAWCVGTCAPMLSTEVAFGHAGAWAGSCSEHAAAKNEALRAAGAFVPTSFQTFGLTVKSVYTRLVEQGMITPQKEAPVPRVPLDYAWAKKLGLVRKPKGFVSTISDDRGEELLYAGWPISKVMQEDMGVGGVLSLLWFKRPLAPYCYRYLETVLMLTADHGPAVCGAHNVIVTARAGKDLISSLISGLCTIGDRFGGACDKAAQQFLSAYTRGQTPEEFVRDTKAQNKLIMGIGHRVKSVHNPDKRVELLKAFCLKHFRETPLINYALQVEKVTTKKKDTLILNVDGLIGVSMCDLLLHCGFFSEGEAKDYIDNGCINGLFVLGRSIGFIGHFLDQKRLKQGLYRHDVDDIAYVLPGYGGQH
ncbi:ATP-citrate synthase isoform x3 [Cyclospora cayetanensis]|uniref:ATP citrate synthase n=1 Tax=Cyclospora cayetanensis TaxID=88456 RepID=A0A1D3CYL1_9EIME|nr:ATP-citrate synthase isoform x3 [Cyclospora cayetanensis]